MSDNSKTKITLFFDTRSYSKKNGGFPIKLRLYYQAEEKHLKTGYYARTEHWIYGDLDNVEYTESIVNKNVPSYVCKKHPNARRLNIQLHLKLQAANNFLIKNEADLGGYDITRVQKAFQYVIDHPDEKVKLDDVLKNSSTLIEAFNKKIEQTIEDEAFGIEGIYDDTLNAYKRYFEYLGIEDIPLVKIDKAWVTEFHNWYKNQPSGRGGKIKPNTIRKKLEQLRHIILTACDDKYEKIKHDDNPLKGYKMPTYKSAKRAIEMGMLDQKIIHKEFNMDEVANIMDLFRQIKLEYGTKRWHARNYLLFMWNLQGMDLVDFAFLKRENIRGNLCEYYRRKVRGDSFLSIDLNEEAIEILNIYDYKSKAPNELIFPWMADRYVPTEGITKKVYKQYRERVKYFNGHINKLAEVLGLDSKLTSKMIRHTWAQQGFTKTKHLEVIRQGMGHGDLKTTRIYSGDLDRRNVRKVNGKVTARKSMISAVEYKLKIDLFQYFHRGKAWGVEPSEFRNRVVKKIHSYDSEIMKILAKTQRKSEWNTKIDQLSTQEFNSYDEVDQWLQENLKNLCENHDIHLITTKY